ncbi:MAG: sulfite exporter TauE/SafE family protein [Mesorhizobium sp.]
MLDVSLSELVLIVGGLIAAGAFTGLLAGVFGVGGGAVLVPILYEFFRMFEVPDEVRMPLCVGTSLAIIIPTSILSFRAHRKRGAVDFSILQSWAVPVVLGVIVGGAIARYAPENLFKLVFIAVASVSAIKLLFGRDSWRLASELPGAFIMRLYGGMIGVLSALMGIGGGQLSSLFMTFYGQSIHRAVATSSGLGPLIAIPGALSYMAAGWGKSSQYGDVALLQWPYSIGYVSLVGLILVFPASSLAAPWGARMAHAMSKRKLEISFGIFLLVVALRFVISL